MSSKLARSGAAGARALLLLVPLAAACGDDDDDPGDPDAGPDAAVEPDAGVDAGADRIVIDGLDGPVDVYFDAQGILHASCQSDADCFAVEGYFHAAHRFIQMDIRRRFGRGKLAALVAAALDVDKENRQMMTARDGTPLEERLLASADKQAIAALEAYSRGVNAWLDDVANQRNGAVLPDEYSFALVDRDAALDDWEPLDSVGCILPLLASLTNQAGEEIFAGNLWASVRAEIAADLFGLRPASPSTIVTPDNGPGGSKARRLKTARRLHQQMAAARPLFAEALRRMPEASLDTSAVGSNNWIVGPSLTGGGALMANDPHLGLTNPAVWYLAHLDAKTAGKGGTIHIAGASFAGLPGVVLGQNEHIAWGATTTVYDSTDVYVETLNEDRTAVVFDDAEVPIVQKSYTFDVAGSDPVTVDFPFVPHHGPIVTAITEKSDTAMSVRWTGHDADQDVNLFLRLATATSVDEARAVIAASSTSTGQNWVVIDRAGNSGWFPYMTLPTRPWASQLRPAWLPVPGDGSAEWGEPIPVEALPQALNPEAGFLATANNDMTGALQDGDPTSEGDTPAMQGFVDPGYRHQRIVERLSEKGAHDLARMQDIQADVFSLLGQALTRPILDSLPAPPADADAAAVYDALAAWDFQCPTGLAGIEPDAAVDPSSAASARGCAAFHVTWARLRLLVFGDELSEFGVAAGAAQPSALIFALTDPSSLIVPDYWNDVSTAEVTETQADIVAAALAAAGAYLRGRLGEDPAGWVWGRLHTATLRADLFSQVTQEFDSPTFANDGGRFTVDVANPSGELGDVYAHGSGPSMRYACQAGEPGVNCTIELPGGQRHYRDSPFYNSMLDEWLTNQPVPFLFSIAEVAADPAESVRVEPR